MTQTRATDICGRASAIPSHGARPDTCPNEPADNSPGRPTMRLVGGMIVAPIQAGKAYIMDLIGSAGRDSLFVVLESCDQRGVGGPL